MQDMKITIKSAGLENSEQVMWTWIKSCGDNKLSAKQQQGNSNSSTAPCQHYGVVQANTDSQVAWQTVVLQMELMQLMRRLFGYCCCWIRHQWWSLVSVVAWKPSVCQWLIASTKEAWFFENAPALYRLYAGVLTVSFLFCARHMLVLFLVRTICQTCH